MTKTETNIKCPYGQHNDRWEWDKKHIQQYRETYEPYTDYERLMLEKAQTNPYWLQMWASQGNVEKLVLPSGLTVLTKKGKGKFEQYVLTDTGEALDFQHEPKDYQQPNHIVVNSNLILKAEHKLAELKKLRRGYISEK